MFAELGAIGLGSAACLSVAGRVRGRRRGLDPRAHGVDLAHQRAFGFPAFLQFCQLLVDALLLGRQVRASGGVVRPRHRLALDDPQLRVDESEPPFAIVDRCGYRVLAHGHARTGGIEQADRLVRQLAGRNVARRKPDRVADRLVEDAHLVVKLERGNEAAKHGDGDFLGRLLHLHRLEATVSAASFSKYFLYSAQVVAAIVRSSPRASAGLRRLAASF